MLGVIFKLDGTAPLRLFDGPLHRIGYLVGVENDLGVDVARRPADRLDKRGAAAQEALFVGVENGHERDLGQIEPLAQQIDANQDIEPSFPQLAQDLDAFDGVQLGVQPFAA